MHHAEVFTHCASQHLDAVIPISNVKYVIWEHEKISVFAAMKAQLETQYYAPTTTPKGALILFTLHAWPRAILVFPAVYVKIT